MPNRTIAVSLRLDDRTHEQVLDVAKQLAESEDPRVRATVRKIPDGTRATTTAAILYLVERGLIAVQKDGGVDPSDD
jgi:hypothetical protein